MGRYMQTIGKFAKLLVDVVDTDRDAVLVITGDTGEGKSVFEWHLLLELSELTGVPFNPVRALIYDREDFNNFINEAPERTGIGIDEAVGLFYARDYHDEQQIALLKKLDRIRYRHLFLLMVIPNLSHIDTHLRNSRVRYWVHIASRKGKGKDGYAHAYIFEKERNPFNPADPWNLNDNRRKFKFGKIDKSVNYVGEIEFRDMSREHYAFYEQVKDVKREIAETIEWARAVERKRRTGGRGNKVDERLKA